MLSLSFNSFEGRFSTDAPPVAELLDPDPLELEELEELETTDPVTLGPVPEK